MTLILRQVCELLEEIPGLGLTIALFTLLRYRQVLPTRGLSPLLMTHSEENCYIFSEK
jgi:hypothetical protein